MAIDEIIPELCNGCGICVNACPCDVIRIDEKRKKAVIKYPEDCMVCGLCLDCPEKAIHLSPGFHQPMRLSWG